MLIRFGYRNNLYSSLKAGSYFMSSFLILVSLFQLFFKNKTDLYAVLQYSILILIGIITFLVCKKYYGQSGTYYFKTSKNTISFYTQKYRTPIKIQFSTIQSIEIQKSVILFHQSNGQIYKFRKYDISNEKLWSVIIDQIRKELPNAIIPEAPLER